MHRLELPQVGGSVEALGDLPSARGRAAETRPSPGRVKVMAQLQLGLAGHSDADHCHALGGVAAGDPLAHRGRGLVGERRDYLIQAGARVVGVTLVVHAGCPGAPQAHRVARPHVGEALAGYRHDRRARDQRWQVDPQLAEAAQRVAPEVVGDRDAARVDVTDQPRVGVIPVHVAPQPRGGQVAAGVQCRGPLEQVTGDHARQPVVGEASRRDRHPAAVGVPDDRHEVGARVVDVACRDPPRTAHLRLQDLHDPVHAVQNDPARPAPGVGVTTDGPSQRDLVRRRVAAERVGGHAPVRRVVRSTRPTPS